MIGEQIYFTVLSLTAALVMMPSCCALFFYNGLMVLTGKIASRLFILKNQLQIFTKQQWVENCVHEFSFANILGIQLKCVLNLDGNHLGGFLYMVLDKLCNKLN